MPVKIKHKQLGNTEIVNYTNWEKHHDHALWDIIEMWDVVKLYNRQGGKEIYQSTVDEEIALDAMKNQQGKKALFFKPLEPIGSGFSIKTQKAHAVIKRVKTIISKYNNNIWVVTIIGGLVVLILGTIILVKLGYLK
jgi:hypothetical protein